MTAKKKIEPGVHVYDPSKLKGELRMFGGSMCDDWNLIVVNQVVQTLWSFPGEDAEQVKRKRDGIIDALIGTKPRDEIEGMIAAQLFACHNASLECFRRAMLREQTSEGRRENLSQANKLSRTFATLVEALNRHRGKGQQKVTVEHVHVHRGGQAIVGNVEAGGGVAPKSEDQPHALAHAPCQTLPSADPTRDRVPVAGNGERQVPDARRGLPGCTEGQ
jgi:hypothetical protein